MNDQDVIQIVPKHKMTRQMSRKNGTKTENEGLSLWLRKKGLKCRQVKEDILIDHSKVCIEITRSSSRSNLERNILSLVLLNALKIIV